MADIEFYEEDTDNAQDDDDLDLDPYNPDDVLIPIQRLEKYLDTDNIFSRQMVARNLLDTLRQVGDNEDDVSAIMRAMVRQSEDPEATVRTELMEQLPHIALYSVEKKHIFNDPIPNYLLPIVVKYLTDSNNQVRKTSQAALLVLLEQDLITKSDIEKQVCPVIMQLSNPESYDDLRTEAVALMSKMAPLVGRDLTERMFLERFASMCTDALFHVRKVCAGNFGDMCSVVGQENTESILLPKFYYLCEDAVWGVRKACAECFMQVSYACSLDTRRNELAELFISLICDQSRWVRMSAFQGLGAFISTFADPSITGLYCNDDGTLVAGDPDEFLPQNTTESREGEEGSSLEEGSLEESNKRSLEDSKERSSEEDKESSSEEDRESMTEERSSEESTDSSSEKSKGSSSGGSSLEESKESSIAEKMAGKEEEEETIQNTSSELSSSSTQNCDSKPSDPCDSKDSQSASDSSGSEQTTAPPGEERMEVDVDEENSNESERKEALSVEEQRAEKYYEHAENSQMRDRILPPANEALGQTSSSSDVIINPDNLSSNVEEPDDYSDKESPGQCNESSNDNNNKLTTVEKIVKDPTAVQSKEAPVITPEPPSSTSRDRDPGCGALGKNKKNLRINVDSIESFNSFQYWREPLPEIDVDAVIEEPGEGGPVPNRNAKSGASVAESQAEEDDDEEKPPQIYTADVSTVCEVQEMVANIGSMHVLGQHVDQKTMEVVNGVVEDDAHTSGLSYCLDEEGRHQRKNVDLNSSSSSIDSEQQQDVIPQALLDHYLSMTDPSRAQTVDIEIARHCAYSLPAVAYTLGRKNWPFLRELYDTLAGDMQWKVRRTLAFSIHELAVIVGEDVTCDDLVPVFNGFIRDLDEVRIGVLKHLTDFLRLLKPEMRDQYLTQISDFLNTDNNRNWRFREELAQQLMLLIELYTPQRITEYLFPVTLALSFDRVAEVRHAAFQVLSVMLKRLNTVGDEEAATSFLNDLIEKFARSTRWNHRQMFAQICAYILDNQAMTQERFATDLLPSLLELGNDDIPNVRISLARTIASYVLHSDYFTGAQNPHHEDLLHTIKSLQSDMDRDVRYFLTAAPITEIGENDAVQQLPV